MTAIKADRRVEGSGVAVGVVVYQQVMSARLVIENTYHCEGFVGVLDVTCRTCCFVRGVTR